MSGATDRSAAMQESLSRWITRLEQTAQQNASFVQDQAVIEAVKKGRDEAEARLLINDFRDEMGHRRHTDAFVLAWRAGISSDKGAGEARALDEKVWQALCIEDYDIEGQGGIQGIDVEGIGSLTDRDSVGSVEVWTEVELSALHGLWNLGASNGAMRKRCLEAGRWLIKNLQPDNATAHPWAVHVFVILALLEQNAEAEHYAQTLVSNSLVQMGIPDRLSAHVLRDAAEQLGEWRA